jgi:hypothetical protein
MVTMLASSTAAESQLWVAAVVPVVAVPEVAAAAVVPEVAVAEVAAAAVVPEVAVAEVAAAAVVPEVAVAEGMMTLLLTTMRRMGKRTMHHILIMLTALSSSSMISLTATRAPLTTGMPPIASSTTRLRQVMRWHIVCRLRGEGGLG